MPTQFASSVALAVGFTLASSAHADTLAPEPERPRNSVSANPVRYALLHFQVEYERTVGTDASVFVQPIYFHHASWYPFAHAPGMTANGFGIDFGVRYFIMGTAQQGAFVSALVSGYRGEVLYEGAMTLDGYVFSPGLQGGYALPVGRLILSAGAGLSYGIATEQAPEGSPRAAQLPHSGLWVNFRANVGLAF